MRVGVRIAVAVVLTATSAAGGGSAVADEPSSGLGRIAYADGELTLDPVEGGARVVEADAAVPGWDTTGVPSGALAGDTVTWALTGVDGPGAVKVRGDGSVLFDSADGVPDRVEVPVGEQADTRWEFSEEGTYRLIFEASGTAVEDGRALSVGTVYTVVVGGQEEAVATTPEPAGSAAAASSEVRTRAALAAPVRAPQVAPAADVVADRKVLDNGHIDFAARVVDGKLQIHVKDGTVSGKTTWREPSSVVLRVQPAAKNTLPDNDAFAFLGKPGSDVWLLDQVQQEGLLWPGWSTDNIEAGKTQGGVTFALTEVEGPGAYALYTYDAMSGADVLFNSKDGVPDAFEVPANTHAHGGWAFTKEGTYRLTFRMSGKLADGTAVSDTETVAFVVGDGDADAVSPGGSSSSGSGTTSPAPTEGGTDTGKSGSTAAGSEASGSMASTGAGDPALVAGAAAGLALVGGGAVWGVRRRRRGV